MSLRYFLLIAFLLIPIGSTYSSELIVNVEGRHVQSLNGKWNIIIDPYENGYFDYRYQPSKYGYFRNVKPTNKWDLIEYSFDSDRLLSVPGDWNTQDEQLFLYEGTIWYHKSFDVPLKPEHRYFLCFGAVNYKAHVYVNGELVGEHEGGFTPFNFEVTRLLQEKDNFVIVKVDNKRFREAVPTLNTDWYNYGGITRDVVLIEVMATYIRDYFVQLENGSQNKIAGWVQLDGTDKARQVVLEIPELNVRKELVTDDAGLARFSVRKEVNLWSPENPKLYEVVLRSGEDVVKDRIGFRCIETRGTDILLNGEPVFLRGICIHEEAPQRNGGRAYSAEHARVLLEWAKELNCNFVRLAHYPHNEAMIRAADEMGLLVWSEIPVYWTILWENEATFLNARNQLTEMITRDRNRASIILWSMANETPVEEQRLVFLKKLAATARELDGTRLITAAMERHYVDEHTQLIDDPFGEFVDVLGCNQYLGWYDGLPEKADRMVWQNRYDKPVIISEMGGGALFGYHGDELTRWTEEFQESVYRHNLDMLDEVEFVKGLSPWILKDFRSPRRPLPRIQEFWNRKGLVSDQGDRKKAFYLLQDYYENKMQSKN
ncbi:beta-glucuronidase [candidate division KSB1 bacterium]|nr:beta-glucuronidase [candidate division KSB1 bacterium]